MYIFIGVGVGIMYFLLKKPWYCSTIMMRLTMTSFMSLVHLLIPYAINSHTSKKYIHM